jgi:hypothetical protein
MRAKMPEKPNLLDPDSLLNLCRAQAEFDKLIEDNPDQSQTVQFCAMTGCKVSQLHISGAHYNKVEASPGSSENIEVKY